MVLIWPAAVSTRCCRGFTLKLTKEAFFSSLFIFWGVFVQAVCLFSWLGS